jgi:Domain of unknown function (DUF927)
VSVDTIRFLRMVAPEDPATWFTVHRRVFVEGKPEPSFPGNSHKTIRSALADIKYWGFQHKDGGFDVYLSMAMYRNTGPHTGIYPRADRTKDNIVACKNLYMDVDVKENGYATTQDALAAIKGFMLWSKLPWPTVMVASGSGGFHLYWTLNIAFDRAEFHNMSSRLINAGIEYGLLFDRQCTTDATRLLRVAGTWNYKREVPTEVKLLICGKEHLDIDLMRDRLSRWPATITPEGKPNNRPPDINDDLTGGMKREYVPSDIDEVAKHCPFVKDTLDTGGAGYPEPLWKYSLALAARCKEPEATAHRLSKGHVGYDLVATENKLAQGHGAGPPACATIAILASQCATCQYRDAKSNPLGVGFKQPPNGHPYQGFVNSNPSGIELPDNYYQRPNNPLVYRLITDDGKPQIDTLAFEYPLLPGSMLEIGKPYQFTLHTIQGERPVTKRFDSTIVADNISFLKAFAAEGLPITMAPDVPRKFMASYLQLLQGKSDTLVTVPPFGWSQDKNGDRGFAFAGEFISPAGTFRCAQPADNMLHYQVMGSEQVWTDLMTWIVTPDRPDLACMVAASFAAPLISLTGESGVLIGVVSAASGIGKSTALLGGQAVWSSPVVGGLSDTVNFTFAKAAALRHLPLFYDEIKGEPQIKTMTQIAFQLTGGREKGRSDRNGKMRVVNEFKTLCGYAANGSIADGVRDEDKGTDASWLRIFEMKGITLPPSKPDFASKVNELRIGLDLNHGGIGKRYATYLGKHYKLIFDNLARTKIDFAIALDADPRVDRFWIAAMASIMLGATIANDLGVVKFPLKEMGNFMFEQFRRMRKEMEVNPADYTKETALLLTLGEFLNEKRPRNMIILDKTWTQPKRPPKGYALIQNDGPDHKWGKLEVQISGKPNTVRITDSALTEWCARTKRPKNVLLEQMKRTIGARQSTGMIGSGSRLAGAKENIWVIDASPGTAIYEYLEYELNFKFAPP